MHEIDPQSEDRLKEALRRLAASSPRSAPAELGAGLLGEFRRRHARRRQLRRAGMLALAACIALAAAWLSLPRKQNGAARRVESAVSAKPAVPAASPAELKPVEGKQTAARSPRRNSAKTATATTASGKAFLALPGYDPAVPMEELQVVRVKLPASALWKIGAPVGADAGERPLTADFVMNQDGTPYAVRLAQ